MNASNRKWFAAIVAVLVVVFALPLLRRQGTTYSAPRPPQATAITPPLAPPMAPPAPLPVPTVPGRSSGVIENAFQTSATRVPVMESGTVSRILSDDNNGSRHQRFILRLASGHTVLIAHNIDIAPRIGSLREGDPIEFSGLYEWNEKGGVVHWTHHDPSGRYAGGHLRHNGTLYR